MYTSNPSAASVQSALCYLSPQTELRRMETHYSKVSSFPFFSHTPNFPFPNAGFSW